MKALLAEASDANTPNKKGSEPSPSDMLEEDYAGMVVSSPDWSYTPDFTITPESGFTVPQYQYSKSLEDNTIVLANLL